MANPWLPRWGDPAVRYNRGWRYPTEAELLFAKTQPTKKGPMITQRYYPSRINDQIPWLTNFATKLPGYETTLNLPPAHVDACVASCKFLVCVLGDWLTAVRDFGPTATSAIDLLVSGTGPDPVVLPVFTAPALPAGVASVPPGALNRLFDLVQLIKNSPGYTDLIGNDLNIIGATTSGTAAGQTAPDAKLTLVQGPAGKAVQINFVKHGHMGVYIECQRGTGAFEFVAIDTEVPYLDARPLLVAGTPEVRQYRLRYWDKGLANGDWSATVTITVGP